MAYYWAFDIEYALEKLNTDIKEVFPVIFLVLDESIGIEWLVASREDTPPGHGVSITCFMSG